MVLETLKETDSHGDQNVYGKMPDGTTEQLQLDASKRLMVDAAFSGTIGKVDQGAPNAGGALAWPVTETNSAIIAQTVYETQTTFNLIQNWDFEAGITGWQAQFSGAVLSSDSTKSKYGSKSLKIVTDGSVPGQGANWGEIAGYGMSGWTKGDVFDVVMWACGTAGNTIRMILFDGTNVSIMGPFTFLSTGVFERFYGIITAPATTATGFFVIDTASAQIVTWNIDQVSITRRIPTVTRADGFIAVDVADDCQAMEAQHVTLGASTDTTITFAGGAVRIIRVVNWDTSNVVLVKDGAIATDVDASATRVGFAPAANVPNTRTFPYKKTTVHLRSAAASVVTVEGFR